MDEHEDLQREQALGRIGRRIRFSYPTGTIPISVTGRACALDCAHCGRHYLNHMISLEAAGRSAAVNKADSLLVSGGCLPDGRVPVDQYLAEIAGLRAGRRINWHLGLVAAGAVSDPLPEGDVISFDLVGDDATIHEVYGTKRSVADYVASFRLLRQRGRVVPHVTIGLQGGRIVGERAALAILADEKVRELVLLVFVPTRGTRYAECQPPQLAEVAAILQIARELMPDCAVTLGCMRPAGSYRRELDTAAVRAGIGGIVNPAPDAVRLAAELGMTIESNYECCIF